MQNGLNQTLQTLQTVPTENTIVNPGYMVPNQGQLLKNNIRTKSAIVSSYPFDEIEYATIPEDLKRQTREVQDKIIKYIKDKYNFDMIYEDVILDPNCPNNFMISLRTKYIDPNKPNLVMFHGFTGNTMTYILTIPYLYNSYNLFIPELIGGALSGRPIIKFANTNHCIEFFVEHMHKYIEKLGLLNYGQKFFLAGHSLGAYFITKYILKYPTNILKVMLFSPAGITDVRKQGTNIYRQAGCCKGCLAKSCFTDLQGFAVRRQNVTNCCCCFNWLMRQATKSMYKDDAPLCEISSQRDELTMKYPKDLEDCVYFIFDRTPPAVYYPSEDDLLYRTNLSVIFVYGKIDWMDRDGAIRLCSLAPGRFKLYEIDKDVSHTFLTSAPKEASEIVLKEFI